MKIFYRLDEVPHNQRLSSYASYINYVIVASLHCTVTYEWFSHMIVPFYNVLGSNSHMLEL